MTRTVLIDCDAGVDDAQAIFMALSSPDVHVIAITVTQGNVLTKQVARNVLRILGVANRLDIPIYVGSDKGILGNVRNPGDYHGNDGLGDVPDPEPCDESLIQNESAPLAIVRLVKEHKSELTLVCLGPLTNVATAIKIDPDIGKDIKDCYIMGGNYHGKGNITVCAEFNFYCDPEGARIVLAELSCPITIVCVELCFDNALMWSDLDNVRVSDTKINNFMRRVEAKPFARLRKLGWPKYVPCDEFLMSVVLNEALVVKETKDVYATVEVKGEYTYGMMVVDWRGLLGRPSNVRLVTAIDNSQLLNMLHTTANWK